MKTDVFSVVNQTKKIAYHGPHRQTHRRESIETYDFSAGELNVS